MLRAGLTTTGLPGTGGADGPLASWMRARAEHAALLREALDLLDEAVRHDADFVCATSEVGHRSPRHCTQPATEWLLFPPHRGSARCICGDGEVMVQ